MGNIVRRTLAAAVLTASAVGGVLASSVPAAHAASTINVPGDYPTIQAAIDAAVGNDTVSVSPGTYHEHIHFNGMPITVRSVSGPDATTIDGDGTGTVVTFNFNEDEFSILRGFTITHGLDAGIQVLSSPTITGNRIVDNGYCTGGGGVYVGGSTVTGSYVGSAAKIIQNTIADNGATGCSGGNAAGGISIINAGRVEVRDNVVTGNTAASGGSGVTVNESPAVVWNNLISGNRSSNAFAQPGVWILDDTGAYVLQNLIVDNSNGVYLFDPSNTTGPRFANNTVARNGGAAFIGQGATTGPQVSNNIFATPSGDAVLCNPNTAWFSHNLAFSGSGTAWSGCNPSGTNGNLTADPQFVDPSGTPGDFHLAASSPAVDAGDNAAPYPGRDFDGNQRPTDGNGDGMTFVDLGVYEQPPVPVAVTSTVVTSSANPSVIGALVTLTATVYATSGTPTGTVQFRDLNDTLGSPVPVTFSAPGAAKATFTTSSLQMGSHPITATFTPDDPHFMGSSSYPPLTQQVGYGVKFLYDTLQVRKVGDNVHIKVQLLNSAGTNVTAASLAVTAQCVAPSPGSCSDPGAIAINAPFVFHKQDKGQSFYDYEVRTKGMAPGWYRVVFTAAGDPVQHTAPLTLKK